MKRKHGMYFCFVFMLITAIFTMAGCEIDKDDDVTFPSGFIGTWKREEPSIYTSTRIFTATTLKISSQSNHRVLEGISGDTYTMSHSDNRNYKITKTIRLVNGKLVITGCEGSYLSHDEYCNGTWIRQ